MKIIPANAIKYFFSNPSLEMVYFEAVANSIDAGATEIEVKIKIKSFTETDSLTFEIKDNGEGFNEKNFEKVKNPAASCEASNQFNLFIIEASFEECNPLVIQHN